MPRIPDDHSTRRPFFFDDGLRFQCVQCGACCLGEPGTIYLSAPELTTLAHHLRLSPSRIIDRYLYPFKDSYSIREDDRGRCLFYNNGCGIYAARPGQCRTFPFWFHNLRSEKQWRKVAAQCPGIGKGHLFTREEILSIVETTMGI